MAASTSEMPSTRARATPSTWAQAALFYRRACDLGSADGCGGLGRGYAYGKGVPRDRGQGLQLLHKACTAGSQWSCARVMELGEQP